MFLPFPLSLRPTFLSAYFACRPSFHPFPLQSNTYMWCCYTVRIGSTFWVCGWNPIAWAVKLKLLSSNGNGNAFIYRIFYLYIFKCGLHQHMSISDLILPTQPMKSWNSTMTRPAHRELLMPYSLRLVSGFFNVPQGYEHWSVVRRGLRFIVLIRED